MYSNAIYTRQLHHLSDAIESAPHPKADCDCMKLANMLLDLAKRYPQREFKIKVILSANVTEPGNYAEDAAIAAESDLDSWIYE